MDIIGYMVFNFFLPYLVYSIDRVRKYEKKNLSKIYIYKKPSVNYKITLVRTCPWNTCGSNGTRNVIRTHNNNYDNVGKRGCVSGCEGETCLIL